MSEAATATVVGGGIAGIAAAVSLAQRGWTVTVLERAPAFEEVGAGLGITRNAMAALDAIGVGGSVRAAGYETVTAGHQDPAGRWLLRVPDTPEARTITTVWGVHRKRLHGCLLDAAGGVELVTGAEVTGVRPGRPGGEPAAVTWRTPTGTETLESSLVVAADGVRSAVRSRLFPAVRPRYGRSTSWRAVIPDTSSDGRLVEVWGPGAEFGTLRVSDGEMYWYGYFRHPEGATFADELAAARARFSGWSPRIRAILDATTADRLMRHDVHHLGRGLPTYTRGRVVVIGDAAHAMLPTMGGGASTAIEDGVCAGRLIGPDDDLAPALAAFDRARRPRCRQIARHSALLARFGADLRGGRRQTVRNAAMRLAPAGAVVRAGAPLVRWTPP